PGELELDPLGLVARRHLDDLAPQLAVGDDDPHVIVGVDLAVEQIDLANHADNAAAGLDPVEDVEGPEQHQHDAGGKVGERALERQANRDTERAQDGDEARRGDPEGRQHGAESQDQHGVARAVGQEQGDGAIDTRGALAQPDDESLEQARAPPAGDQNDDGADDAQTVGRYQRHQGVGGI